MGGSHWNIFTSRFSHFSDTEDDTLELIVPFLSLLLIHSTLECPLEASFSPSSSQFSILLGRTFNPLKGGGD